MSTLKPLPKASPTAVRRASAVRAAEARRRRDRMRLLAAVLTVAVVALTVALIVRARANAPVAASNVPVSQAVRTLNAPVGQTADGYWYKGQDAAPVTVTVFGDFQCPSCLAAYQRIEGGIDQNYVETGKIKFVFHDFPLPMHPNAVPAAQAARAAGAQGKFWAMHDLLYARQTEWADSGAAMKIFKSYAGELGLDQVTFDSAVDNKTYASAIDAAVADSNKQGINATPTYLVDGKAADTNALAAAIDAALAAKGR